MGTDVTGSMLGILPPVIAAGAVTSIMKNMMPNAQGQGGMFGSPAPVETRIDGSGGSGGSGAKISLRVAGKLFGANKVRLAKTGVEVTNADGDILIYNAGNFYLLGAPELPRLV